MAAEGLHVPGSEEPVCLSTAPLLRASSSNRTREAHGGSMKGYRNEARAGEHD